MGSAKYDIERFSKNNDFGLWRVKMRAMLVQQGLVDALEGEKGLNDSLTKQQKEEMLNRAHSSIILSLGEKAFREVSSEESAQAVLLKLEQLYMLQISCILNKDFILSKW